MAKDLVAFSLRLIGFSSLLFLTHCYLLSHWFTGTLFFPLWTIYCFHTILVFSVYAILRYNLDYRPKDIFKYFMVLTLVKMILAVVFFIPFFRKETSHEQLEVINFFVPYFLFLFFEIFALNKLLQKS